MSSVNLPAPSTSKDEGDSLKELRAQLKAQRIEQKQSLAKHKRTTFLAVETAKKGTTFYNAAKLREALALEEDDAADEAETNSPKD